MSIRSLYTISVIGQNRLGFVSNFLKKIYEADGNIINSSMKTLGDNYTLNIQTEFPRNIEIGRFLNKNIDPNSFFVFANSNSTFDEYNPYYPIDIQVKLADTSGVIYATTDVLSNISAHVDSLKSSVEPAPMCSTPLFTLDMTAMIPTKHQPDFVCSELESIKDRFDSWEQVELDWTYTMRSVGEYMEKQKDRKELLLLNYKIQQGTLESFL